MIAIPNMEMPDTCDMCPIEGCEYINGKFTCPLIDIVRCKECKHWHEGEWYNTCDKNIGHGYEADFFCAYGEKRNNSKNNSNSI